MNHLFSKLILFSGILIASVAAFFSVTGISQLFSAALIPVMVMACALEIGKLVSVSFLYRYWKETSRILRYYLVSGTIILALITSAGIYGYLSNAYAKIAVVPQMQMNQLTLLDSRIQEIDSTKNRYKIQTQTLESRISQRENRTDSLYSKNKITSARTQERSTKEAESSLNNLNKGIDSLQSVKDSLVNARLVLKNGISSNRELGSFIYIASALGVPLDTVVKWFILVIVAVFDPMSISLFLAYNVTVKKSSKSEIQNPLKETKPTQIKSIPKQSISEKYRQFKESEKKPVEEVKLDFKGPYYRNPDYDWGNDEWRSDPEAIEWKRHNT